MKLFLPTCLLNETSATIYEIAVFVFFINNKGQVAEKGETTFVKQCFSGIKQILAKQLRDFPRNTNICINSYKLLEVRFLLQDQVWAFFEDVTKGACFNLRWNCK